MFLPLGDEPNPRGIPLVTYALIAANVAVYVFVTLPLSATAASLNDPALREYIQVISRMVPEGMSLRELVSSISAYDLVTFTWGYRPADPHYLALFTAMFLHGGFMHLFGNMLFLWIYGDNVEHRLGSLGFLFWYLATGVAATLFHGLFDASSQLPLVGASGAISGVLGFYFLWFPHNRVRLWIFLFPLFANIVLVPARIVLGIYLILDNVVPYVVSRGVEGGGVAYGAHIGGFLAGLVVAFVANRREVRERPAEYRAAARAEAEEEAGATSDGLADAVGEGRMERAAELYFRLTPEQARRILSPPQSLALADWLRENGHTRAAVVVYQRHLRDYPIGAGAAEAHAGLGLVQLRELNQPAAAYQHFVEALGLDPSPETETIVRTALREIAARQKFQVGRTRTG
jgi:membrane associated rhomboid family serine protease